MSLHIETIKQVNGARHCRAPFLFPGGPAAAQEMQNPGIILAASQTVAENSLPKVYLPETPDVNTATVGEALEYNHAVDNALHNYAEDLQNYSADAKAVNMSAASDMDGLNTEVEKAAETGNSLVFQDAINQYYARSYEMTGNTLSIPQEALDAFEEASGKAISPEKESAFSALTSAETMDELNDAYSAYKNAAPDMDAKEKADLDTNYALMSQQISGKMESPMGQASTLSTTQSAAEAAFENGVAGTTPESTPAATQRSTSMTAQANTPAAALAQNAGIPYGEVTGMAAAPYTDAFGMPQSGASFPGGESLAGYNAGGAGDVDGNNGNGKSQTDNNGTFTIDDWAGYPDTNRPTGPFRILEGDEYANARKIANNVNTNLHKQNSQYDGLQIHEVHPVKFGGSPTDIDNKIILTPKEHAKYTTFWNRILKEQKGKITK